MELAYNENWTEIGNAPSFNGNISAVKWSNNLGLGDLKERAYSYSYDPLNRIKEAQHHRQLINTWGSVGDYSVSNLNYDYNGNILSLTRKNDFGQNMDALSYTYTGNQLMTVTDGSGNEEGFKDGNTGSQDYFYDSAGNMIIDKNKDITDITYNHLNLPDTVIKSNGEYLKFIYDAAGVKLAQEVYDASDNLKKRIDYIGEFIYENDTLQFIHHDEGRVVANEIEGYEYQYNHKDQLGNTRLVFTTRPKFYEFTATMELDKSVEEESLFSNVTDTRVTFVGAAQSPDKVAKLDTAHHVGPGISLPVNPGDTVRMEGYAYFEGGDDYSNGLTLEALVTAVAGAFGGVNGGTEAQQAIYNSFDNAYGIIGTNSTGDDLVPAAFLNYILFDKNMSYKRSGFKQISSAANFSKEHVVFDDDIIIDEPGFIYCYVTMESALGVVYWDDFKVTLNESAVVQMQDFYPFGLSFNGYMRVNAKINKFRYNGKELLEDLDLDWYDYGARMYMADIGRWNAIDPMAEKYLNISPFSYVANIPTLLIDPDGRKIEWNTETRKQKRLIKRQIRQARKSDSFNQIWKTLKKSNNVYTISATPETDLAVNDGGAKFGDNFGEVTKLELSPGDFQTFELGPIGGVAGGTIFINTDVVNYSNKDITISQYLQRQIIEEVIHAGQFENLSNGTKFINNHPGHLNLEFEAKTIAGIVQRELGTFGNLESAPWDKLPHTYGYNGGNRFGSGQVSQYNQKFQQWQQVIDKRRDGYGGFKSTTPGAVTNDDPLLLQKLIKQ